MEDEYATIGVEDYFPGTPDANGRPAANVLVAEWDEPVAFTGSITLPGFPADAFPDWLDEYVRALATATQTPLDLPASMVLAALAAAAGGRAVVEARSGWREPTNLFIGIAMAPGNRKSAVVQAVTAPLHEAEHQQIEAAKHDVVEANSQRKIADGHVTEATRRAMKARADNDADAEKLEHAAIEAALFAEAITVPTMPRLVADDATPEALASLMAAQGGRIALISAEGGPFDAMAGRYSKFPNLDVYLKGHAGDHLRVDRQGRNPEIIERPALTVALAFQPAVLPQIAGRDGFRARGLLARFLFSVPRSYVGRRAIGSPSVELTVSARYEETLRALVLTLAEWRDPCVITLSPEANERLLAYERALEPRLAPSGDLGILADWGSKLAGAVVRIAGLLHLAGRLKNGYREPISPETMAAAETIGDYFLAHARAAHGLMNADPAVEDARAILRWALTRDEPWFSKRDAHRANRARFEKATDLAPALDRLEDHGWIRRRPDPPQDGPGRPPSPVYDVNPRAADLGDPDA